MGNCQAMRGTGPVKQPIQRYYLYGDQHSDVDLDFLHVEPIRDRSGAHDWIIRPHAHPDHVQILFIAQGGGWLRVEDREFDIPTPSLMVIPSAMVHEIRFEPGTDGHVITAAVGYVIWDNSKDLPDYAQLKEYSPPVMTRVHAADGSLVAEYAKERRLYLPIQAVPDLVVHAFLSAEDRRFYEHGGIDIDEAKAAALLDPDKAAKSMFMAEDRRVDGTVVRP